MLATALNLNHAVLLAAASWPIAVSRKILANMDPGSTPKKRKPDVVASGQIQKPGGDGSGGADAIVDSPLESRKKLKAARSLLSPAPSAAKEVSSSSEDGEAGGITGSSGIAEAPPKKMPEAVESSSNFNQLVEKRCALPWLTVPALEAAIPTQHWHQLYLATSWSARARSDYDKMIAKQMQGGDSCISRREDPTNVACVHRLRLAYIGDAGLALTGKLLALIVVAENPSDFSSKASPRLGGAWQRANLELLLSDLRRHWAEILDAASLGRGVGSVTTNNIPEGLHSILERRYTRFSLVFPAGEVREEVLANTPRQCAEVRVLVEEFFNDLSHRGGALEYTSRNEFLSSRYLTLLPPVLDALLGTDTGAVPGSVSIRTGAARLSNPEPKPLRSTLLETGSASTVSFADQTDAPAPPSAAAPEAPPAFPHGRAKQDFPIFSSFFFPSFLV